MVGRRCDLLESEVQRLWTYHEKGDLLAPRLPWIIFSPRVSPSCEPPASPPVAVPMAVTHSASACADGARSRYERPVHTSSNSYLSFECMRTHVTCQATGQYE